MRSRLRRLPWTPRCPPRSSESPRSGQSRRRLLPWKRRGKPSPLMEPCDLRVLCACSARALRVLSACSALALPLRYDKDPGLISA
mmetsp:Transcript_52958/g.121596  ORF Transcript_52958/g.121596 Transcript_52958/m.121596 type:complete len:85 (+) Transcript_52958:755-1009(+)